MPYANCSDGWESGGDVLAFSKAYNNFSFSNSSGKNVFLRFEVFVFVFLQEALRVQLFLPIFLTHHHFETLDKRISELPTKSLG